MLFLDYFLTGDRKALDRYSLTAFVRGQAQEFPVRCLGDLGMQAIKCYLLFVFHVLIGAH